MLLCTHVVAATPWTWLLEMMRCLGAHSLVCFNLRSINISMKSRYPLISFAIVLPMNMERKARLTIHLIADISHCLARFTFLLGTGSFKGLCYRNRAPCFPLYVLSRLGSWASSHLSVSASMAVETLGLHMLATTHSSTWVQGIQTQGKHFQSLSHFPTQKQLLTWMCILFKFICKQSTGLFFFMFLVWYTGPWDLYCTRVNSRRVGPV